jgi:hypothetical protein
VDISITHLDNMGQKYWLDLYTGKTWEEFLKNDANVTGFRKRREKIAKEIQIGDYLLCYLTGISRFVAVCEVKSKYYIDNSPIWTDEHFPLRFNVKLLYKLKPETAIPVPELRDKLSIFKGLTNPNNWSGFFRGSPMEFKKEDGKIIFEAIKTAVNNPIKRKYDKKKYWRTPRVYESTVGDVTVPEEEEAEEPTESATDNESPTHEEIQWLLLKLGSDLGLNVWVARNDRNKSFNGQDFQQIPRLLNELPRQFEPATNKTIELIDVLWLRKDAILAAFEIEHTTSIYSGLLRMSDLVTMQPNIKIDLYMVAPDDRREKIKNEINRPTFARLNPSLPTICKFIPYSKLKSEILAIGPRMKHMNSSFIEDISENCKIEGI